MTRLEEIEDLHNEGFFIDNPSSDVREHIDWLIVTIKRHKAALNIAMRNIEDESLYDSIKQKVKNILAGLEPDGK